MTKNEAVNTIINGIMFADYEMRKFVDALKMLSKDEIEKVSIAIEHKSGKAESPLTSFYQSSPGQAGGGLK
ncbi:MAG: hypothetical protein HY096_13125 [Nitrospinae bacterium]|nr:hypothetical protein [Nitrospinota bacterium]